MRRSERVVVLTAALALLCFSKDLSADEKQDRSIADGVAWGKPAKGLQLGIFPEVKKDGHRATLFDGSTLSVSIQVRNAGDTSARILPSIFECAALGHLAGVPVTKLILTPIEGGEPLTITYQGINHVCEDSELDADDLRYYATELAPGKTLQYPYVVKFTPGEKRTTTWQRTGKVNRLPTGKYQLKAVFVVDRRESPWKGELTSGSLDVEVK